MPLEHEDIWDSARDYNFAKNDSADAMMEVFMSTSNGFTPIGIVDEDIIIDSEPSSVPGYPTSASPSMEAFISFSKKLNSIGRIDREVITAQGQFSIFSCKSFLNPIVLPHNKSKKKVSTMNELMRLI